MALDQKQDLFRIVETAVDSVRPSSLFPRVLADPGWEDLSRWKSASHRSLLCLGKASLTSAQSLLSICPCSDYFVVGPPGAAISAELDAANVRLGSHPIPDQRSLQAARDALLWLQKLPRPWELLIVISGGSSALVSLPADGVSFESKMRVNELLIRSGATIQEINAVRKHLSAIKGGLMAREAAGLNVVALVISDVIGDDLSTIGSGPFYPDATTFAWAHSILERYQLLDRVPVDARARIESGTTGAVPETLKGEPGIPHHIVASNNLAIQKAKETATGLGYRAEAVPEVSGPVEQVAERIASLIATASPRTAFILGGEVTVRVGGNGKGGRNQHLALLLTEQIRGKDVTFAAVGTDGIDGNSPAAGAWIDGRTAKEAEQKGVSVSRALSEFDSFPLFDALGHTIVTGPSGTNVMDLYIALT